MKYLACIRLSLFALALAFSTTAFADWGIFQSYLYFDIGAGNDSLAGNINADAHAPYIGHHFGSFDPSTDTFLINGGGLKTWKNGNSNVCGGNVFYRVYNLNDTPGAFDDLGIGFFANLGGNDQYWITNNAGVDILTALAPGEYAIEVFWEANGNQNDPSGCGEFLYDSNLLDDWRAFFTVVGEPSLVIDFEGVGETKGGYASGTVTLSGLDWDITEGVIGTLANDFKFGARAARLRGYGASAMTMLEDKTNGIGNVSFKYRRFGTDAQVAHVVEYSTNGGVTWTQLGDAFTALASNNPGYFSENLEIGGSVRIQIRTEDGSGSVDRRLNIDDIVLTDFCEPSSCADILDSFDDGDFTANPVWTGDVSDWSIVEESDVADGASCANTLRLAVPGGEGNAYLSTEEADWQGNQEWSFWLGRRGQGYTSTNTVSIWLYADQSDLTSPTINGYRLHIGDNLTTGDSFFLQRVDNGVATILMSTDPIPNGRSDIGTSLRVTRTAAGTWEVYSSNLNLNSGEGTVATDCPATDATIFQGTADDNNITPSGTGYIGIEVAHTTGFAARSAVEFDQISFASDSDFVNTCYAMLDDFTDGNITSNPTWVGDTGSWTVAPSSDVAGGATGSATLRLNHTPSESGIRYLSTGFSDWELNQEWSFWLGRRNQAYTGANNVAIWLYADNSDLTSATINGYRLFIGDNTGGDEFFLQRVDNGVPTDILASSELTNGISDVGVSLRITRNNLGLWNLYTSTIPLSSGDGTIATDCPLDDATVDHGSATDDTYTPSGAAHVGLVVTHSAGADARAAVEFDQFLVTGDSVVTDGCTDDTACNYDPAANNDDGSCDFTCIGCTDQYAMNYDVNFTIDDGSCVYPNIIITEIHYDPDDAGGFTDEDYEFIELYNLEAVAIDLSDWTFTAGITFTFPTGASIAPGEYIVIARNATTYDGNGYQVFQFTGALSNTGETITLETPSSVVINSVTYNNSLPWPTAANGTGPSLELSDTSLDNTIGSNWIAQTINGTPGGPPLIISGCTDPSANNYDVNATVEDGTCTFDPATIVITEIHHDPCTAQGPDSQFEFLELFNASASTIDLSGWEILGFEFTFPAASSIDPGEYIVIVQQGAGSNYSGNGYQVFELTNPAGLNNNGEPISVLDDLGNIIDYVNYETSGAWPSEANGNCSSLEVLDPLDPNNAPTNWQASYTFGGSPGGPSSGPQGCTDCDDMMATVDTFIDADFEDGTLNGWMQGTPGDWAASDTNPISGTYSLKHEGGAGTSGISYEMDALSPDLACTKWSFTIHSGAWSPSVDNRFAVFLLANEEDVTSATVDGYAVGVDLGANAQGKVTLWQVVDGTVSNVLITHPYEWDTNETVFFEVSHTEAGDWVLKLDVEGGTGLLLAAQTPVMATAGISESYFGIRYSSDVAAAGAFRIDDIQVTQCGLEETYYSVETGDVTDAIWNTDTNAIIGETVTFSQYKNMVVRNGQTVTVDTDFTVNDFTIDAANGAGIFNAANFSIDLMGDFTNDGGLFNADESTLSFNGVAAQSIGGSSTTTFENLVMNNANGLTLNAAAVVHGVFSPVLGDFDAGANALILSSDVDGTGSIGEITPDASYTGTTVVERYIPAGFQNWVNLSSPISGLTLNEWNASLVTSGFPGSDFPTYNLNNVLQYDETVAGGLNDGFVGATNINDALDAIRGYFVFMQPQAQNVSVTGNIQQGSLTTPLNYTTTGVPENDGWELVANRYPSEIDFEELFALATNIAPTYYVYDAENASYATYTAGVGGTASGFIPSSQSFWVQTIDSGAELQFEEYMKSATGTAFERNYLAVPRVTISLNRANFTHETTLVFEEGAAYAFEPGKDAFVLGSQSETAPQVSLIAEGGQRTLVNRLDVPQGSLAIPVHVRAAAEGSYTLKIDAMAFLPQGLCFSIEDLETGAVTGIEAGDEFVWEQSEAFTGERFILHIAMPVHAEALPTVCAEQATGTINVNVYADNGSVVLEDLDGNTIATQSITGAGTISFENLFAGDYKVVYLGEDLVCSSTSIEMYLDDAVLASIPALEGQQALCAEPNAAIEVSGFIGDFTTELYRNGELVDALESSQSVIIESLTGEVYEVVTTDICLTESFEIDLRDPNALNEEVMVEAIYGLSEGVAFVTAEVITDVPATVSWTIEGEVVSNSNTMNVELNETGVYNYTVEISGESCYTIRTGSFEVQEVSSILETDDKELGLLHAPGEWMLVGTAVTGQINIDLMAIDGSLIRREAKNGEGLIRMNNMNLAHGIYMIRVFDAQGHVLGTLRAVR